MESRSLKLSLKYFSSLTLRLLHKIMHQLKTARCRLGKWNSWTHTPPYMIHVSDLPLCKIMIGTLFIKRFYRLRSSW